MLTSTEALLSGRYRLVARIATGGMATVWRALDEVLGRDVAVKVMHPSLSGDDAFVERFRREATNAARLNHRGIAMVYDWGRDGESVFMVMELVAGTNLRDYMEMAGPLSLDDVRRIVTSVAAAVDCAHAHGIVHRDIKPENILIGGDGSVKVVDFGVAHALADVRITAPDGVIGTMHYVAPEQLTGEAVDHRADVYALGLLAYEMLSGRPAFFGDTPEAIAAARLSRTAPSPGVSPSVDAAIAQATAVRPADRFPTAGQFAAAFGAPQELRDTAAVDAPVVHLPTQLMERPAKARRRRRMPTPGKPFVIALLALAVLAAAVFGGLALVPRSAVPTLAGQTTAAARVRLVRAGLKPGAIRQVFDDAAPGTVLRTEPGAATKLRRNQAVTLVVSKGPDLLTMPSVAGKPLAGALKILAEAGFTAGERSEAYSASVDKGSVISQDPSEGRIKRGTAVNLVVSKGPEYVTVPDVGGKLYADAKRAVESAGLDAVRADDYSDTVAEGFVLKTTPDASQRAVKGSKVTIVVSKGPRSFDMPTLIGMDRATAKAKAQSLGLVVGNEYAVPGSGKPKGQVQGQNPPAGTQVRKGAQIDIYYAA